MGGTPALGVLGVLVGLAGCHAARPAPRVRGPLAARIQHPLGLTFLAHRPRAASVMARGESGIALETSYTSIFEVGDQGGDVVVFDGETARGSVRLRHGLGAGFDLEIEGGVLYPTSGFLDGFLDDFHTNLLLPDGGRGDMEEDQYLVRVLKDGSTLYELEEDRVGWVDTSFALTRELQRETNDAPGIAARVAIELPTGSEDRGFGNGGVDWGGGVGLEKSVGRWTWTAGLDVTFPAQPDAFARAGVTIRDIFQGRGGVEYRWNDRTSLLLSLVATTPYTRDLDPEEIDREILDLGLGAAWDVGASGRLFVTFHEDLVAATGPDFSLRVGLTFGL